MLDKKCPGHWLSSTDFSTVLLGHAWFSQSRTVSAVGIRNSNRRFGMAMKVQSTLTKTSKQIRLY